MKLANYAALVLQNWSFVSYIVYQIKVLLNSIPQYSITSFFLQKIKQVHASVPCVPFSQCLFFLNHDFFVQDQETVRMLESYVTPLLMSYVNRYIKNLKPSDLQLSLWGGDVVLSKLDLKLDVLEQVKESFV